MRVRLLPDSPLGWTPYVWLIYLTVYIVYALNQNDSAIDWAIDGAGLAAFLTLYFRAFWLRGTAMLKAALAIVALGVLLSPRNAGASCFFIYGAAFVGDAHRPAAAIRWLFVIVFILGLEAWLVPLPPQAWVPGIVFSLIVGGTNTHFAEVRRKDEALLKAHQDAEHLAAVAERERIARDLHDLLGHTLSVIVIKSELASKLADRDPVRAAQEIREVERISRNALNEVRQAIHGYRGERLAQELTNGRRALEAAGVALTDAIEPVALNANEERALALGLREAVTNIIRHARATHCHIALARDGAVVRLTIEDDGVGGVHADGAGLAGMKARLTSVGGRVGQGGDHGTRLVLEVPMRAGQPARELALS
jgi:two-component system, NarL family, sensor histidine kinase DesK